MLLQVCRVCLAVKCKQAVLLQCGRQALAVSMERYKHAVLVQVAFFFFFFLAVICLFFGKVLTGCILASRFFGKVQARRVVVSPFTRHVQTGCVVGGCFFGKVQTRCVIVNRITRQVQTGRVVAKLLFSILTGV